MHRIPTPAELKKELPLTPAQKNFIAASRQVVKNLLLSRENRIGIVAGPCSIHDLHSARDYALRFKDLSRQVEKNCFLVMRVYAEKARTTTGWKGLLYDPSLDGSYDLEKGLFLTRQLLLECAELQIPTATEFVDPLAASYFDDLITWGFIGARTCASQPHRQLASRLDLPVGFKNSTDGNLDNAINGVITAHAPHFFMHSDEEGRIGAIQSNGNPDTHVVLRGSDRDTNYDVGSVEVALEKLRRHELNAKILIDCAHGNCQKEYLKQKEVFLAALDQIVKGNTHIIGMMLESHLEAGRQSLSVGPSSLKYAVSITDPCIDWSMTEELVLLTNSMLDSSSLYSSSSTSISTSFSSGVSRGGIS